MNHLENNYDNYNEQLKILQNKFNAALPEYKKAYVLYNSNPDFNEYKSTFFSLKQNLQDMNSNLFLLVNDIAKGIDNLNENISEIDVKLKKEKSRFSILKEKLDHSQGQINGSDIMMKDYQELYFRQYVQNITTILGTIFVFVFFIKTFKLR